MEEEWTDVTDGALIKTTEQKGKEPKVEQSWDTGVNNALCLQFHPLEKYCVPALQQLNKQINKKTATK